MKAAVIILLNMFWLWSTGLNGLYFSVIVTVAMLLIVGVNKYRR